MDLDELEHQRHPHPRPPVICAACASPVVLIRRGATRTIACPRCQPLTLAHPPSPPARGRIRRLGAALLGVLSAAAFYGVFLAHRARVALGGLPGRIRRARGLPRRS